MIEQIPEIPLIVEDKVQRLQKTKEAVLFLKRIKAWNDIQKVYKSKRFRAGKGKMRNRRRIHRLGPLLVYGKDKGLVKAFRNIPGVSLLHVNSLNLLRIAPGGHVGRFTIWTESAFKKLDKLYGTWTNNSKTKKDYNLPTPKMTNTDLSRLLKSDEIQRAIRPPNKKIERYHLKKNPLKNVRTMLKLNPYAAVLKRAAQADTDARKRARLAKISEKRGIKLETLEGEKRRKIRAIAHIKGAKKTKKVHKAHTKKVKAAKKARKTKGVKEQRRPVLGVAGVKAVKKALAHLKQKKTATAKGKAKAGGKGKAPKGKAAPKK